MVNYDRIYDLMAVHKRTALHVTPRTDIADEYNLYMGITRPSSAIVFEFLRGASGTTAHDLVSTSLTPLLLISIRVVQVLRPFSGWSTYPVEVYGKKGELIPGYHGLTVTGRCGPIDDSRSVPRIVPPPVPQGRASRRWFGVYFDESTWDGNDLFAPPGSGYCFVTDRVKCEFERAGISNAEFQPLSEMENMSSGLLFGKSL